MRLRIEAKKRNKARGVSLPPEMERAALAKCGKADISFSKYVQRLITIDIANNLIKPLAKVNP